MDERLHSPAVTDQDYEAVLDQMLTEMRQVNEQMRQDQDRISRNWNRLAELRRETDRLRTETREALKRLKAAVLK